MIKMKIVCAVTMLAAVPAAAETKSRPIRQELVHEYARKQLPLVSAAHAATYACHEVTPDCDFAKDLRNTERCHNAALVATIGDASAFKSGRHLAAWLGLVPRQTSSGCKERLGHISKAGDGYLRRMLVNVARVVVRWRRTTWPWLPRRSSGVNRVRVISFRQPSNASRIIACR
jgi:hypothetical protein